MGIGDQGIRVSNLERCPRFNLYVEAYMHFYKIHILDQRGSITLAYDFEGPDDLSALDESKKHSDRNSVEIWQKSRLVARIDQGGEAANGLGA